MVLKTDKEALKKMQGKINIIPDSEWAKHIYRNRAKLVNQNEYDFVFNFIADGIMANIEERINDSCYEEDFSVFHQDIMKDKYRRFIDDYYNAQGFSLKEIVLSCDLTEYKNYHQATDTTPNHSWL